jgi:hypothetical protein
MPVRDLQEAMRGLQLFSGLLQFTDIIQVVLFDSEFEHLSLLSLLGGTRLHGGRMLRAWQVFFIAWQRVAPGTCNRLSSFHRQPVPRLTGQGNGGWPPGARPGNL